MSDQLQSLCGVKRTCLFALHMSAFDPKRTSAHRKEPQAFAALSCRTAADYRDLGVVSSLSTPWPGTEVLSRSIAREVPNRYA